MAFGSIFTGLMGGLGLLFGGNDNSNVEAQIQQAKLNSATRMAEAGQQRLGQARREELDAQALGPQLQQRAMEQQLAALREALLRRGL